MEPLFCAGAALANITPPLGISINGYFNDRQAERIHDELNARCLALDDGTNQLAIAVCDSCMLPRDLLDRVKTTLQKRIGLSPERILISATHTHFAPSSVGLFQSEPNPAYARFLEQRIADGIIRAMQNLAPAKIGVGSGTVPGEVFNRRWKMKPGAIPPNPFGGTNDLVKMNPPVGSPDLIEPAGPVDAEVYVLSVRRPNGDPIALLANYGLHYVGAGGADDISADYFGAFCDMVASRIGKASKDAPFVAILSNGTSGDVNNIDFRKQRLAGSPYERNNAVASVLCNEVMGVLERLEHRRWAPLDSRQEELTFRVRLPDEEEVRTAKAVLAAAKQPGNLRTPTEVYARETVLMAELPPTTSLLIQVLQIGELAIAAIPCEVFAETGLAIKKQAPFRQAFTIGLANGSSGYLPTPAQHRLGGYETWRARSSCLEVEAEPRVLKSVTKLMSELRED